MGEKSNSETTPLKPGPGVEEAAGKPEKVDTQVQEEAAREREESGGYT